MPVPVRYSQFNHNCEASPDLWDYPDEGFTERLLQPKEEELLPKTYNIGLTDLVERPSIEQAELSLGEMTDSVPALLLKIKQYRPRIVSFVGKGIWLIFEKGLSKRLKGTGSTEPRLVKAKLEGNEVPLNPKTIGYSPQNRAAKNAKPRKKDKNEGYGLQPYRVVHDEVVKEEDDTNTAHVRETLFFVMPSTSGRVVSHQLTDKAELFKQVREYAQEHKDGKIELSKFQEVPC